MPNNELGDLLDYFAKKAVEMKFEVEIRIQSNGEKEIVIRPWAPWEPNYGVKLPDKLVDSVTKALDAWCETTRNEEMIKAELEARKRRSLT